MKKQFIVSVMVAVLILVSCKSIEKKETSMEQTTGSNEAVVLNNFVGSEYKGNFIWGAAMNFAWNEFGNSILKEKLMLNVNNEKAQAMGNAFNNFDLNDKLLDEESYYVKAGYGQNTLNTINKEVKAKFPKKSFEDLDFTLSDTDIISYAYLLKEVSYEYTFEDDELAFSKTPVKGFTAIDSDTKKSIKVIDYTNDDKFIISIALKDKNDSLILAKGYDMQDPSSVLKIVNTTKATESLENKDFFWAPNINLNYHRDYQELVGAGLKNKGFENYTISNMFENIKFKMDKTGARVENEAVIIAIKSMPLDPRSFILNEPYWIIMKRTDSPTPYFLLGVNNTELMEKTTTTR